jgi:hypothetical protein
MKLHDYSIGLGDRFGHQGKALLTAIMKAEEKGINITPVWNKSFREHQITNTQPISVLKEAQEAVNTLNWKGDYYIDADHINLSNVEFFLDSCNYFTIDVVDYIGKNASKESTEKFIQNYNKYLGEIKLPICEKIISITTKDIKEFTEKYLTPIKEAKKIYERIAQKKGKDNFIVEISLDEAENAQTPIELFLLLNLIVEEGIPIQAIAPKFIGRFNKGVDYQGDLENFKEHFESILAIIQLLKSKFNLPKNLKLSIHSGSDKFSIYPIINKLMKKYDDGIHLKTAGTTWLEEIIGLALASDEGLEIVREIYQKAYERYNELCTPYAMVIDINKKLLPHPKEVSNWDGNKIVKKLQHNPFSEEYNPHFRQLFHIAYKIAAEMGSLFTNSIEKYEDIIAQHVTSNIYDKHIKPLFS